MSKKVIDIGRDFSPVPAGRFKEDGPFNGRKFRQKFLVPALASFQEVYVDIDRTEGYGSSFLEEAFGGLIREEGFTLESLQDRLVIVSNQDRTKRYKRLIEKYLRDAANE